LIRGNFLIRSLPLAVLTPRFEGTLPSGRVSALTSYGAGTNIRPLNSVQADTI
jgi:hypothetical protein